MSDCFAFFHFTRLYLTIIIGECCYFCLKQSFFALQSCMIGTECETDSSSTWEKHLSHCVIVRTSHCLYNSKRTNEESSSSQLHCLRCDQFNLISLPWICVQLRLGSKMSQIDPALSEVCHLPWKGLRMSKIAFASLFFQIIKKWFSYFMALRQVFGWR